MGDLNIGWAIISPLHTRHVGGPNGPLVFNPYCEIFQTFILVLFCMIVFGPWYD